jgi:O-antigen ligase
MLIALEAFCAYLTATRFFEGTRHNIGAFEVSTALLFCFMILYFLKHDIPIRTHPVIIIIGLMVIAAGISLVMIPPLRLMNGVFATLIMLFMFMTVLTLYNLVSLDERYLVLLLRALVFSAAIASIWGLMEGISSGGYIGATGSYRGRGQMGMISLSSFWIVLTYAFWPKVSKWERLAVYFVLPLVLYCLAVSGRKSVYIAFALGLAGLAVSLLFAYGRGRLMVLGMLLVVGLTLGLLYSVVSDYWTPAAFFKDRAEEARENFLLMTGIQDEAEATAYNEDQFVQLQQQGAVRALAENPILGIGWGGFYRSKYSPTGHEMHSTPFRFLAELGLVGITLYLCLMGRLFGGAFKLWLSSRKTSYQSSAMILCVALCSLSVSYLYNRQVSERTGFLIIVILLGFEALILRKTRSGSSMQMQR